MSSIKKRSLTTSISGIRKKLNHQDEQVQKQEEILIGSNSKFSTQLLLKKWNEFADVKKKRRKMGLYTTLTRSSPILKNDFNVDFHRSKSSKNGLTKRNSFPIRIFEKKN